VTDAAVLRDVCIALGDDELILGHRHSEWTGFAPHIEEDVAFSSIAQDEIGHAAAYYSVAAAATGDDVDAIAFGRPPDEYRNAVICERPNQEWGYTLGRHWLYDVADDLRLETLERSGHAGLAALATKIRREERYHLLHADMWLKRVAHGPLEGRTKLVHGLTTAFSDAGGLFEPLPAEDRALEEGILTTPSAELRQAFLDRVTTALDEVGLPPTLAPERDAEFLASSSGDLIERSGSDGDAAPVAGRGLGGRSGRHTDDFVELWDVMTRTYREDPGASW